MKKKYRPKQPLIRTQHPQTNIFDDSVTVLSQTGKHYVLSDKGLYLRPK